MTPEQQAAFVIAQAACASAEIAGMQAENERCLRMNGYDRHTQQDFLDVIERYTIGHNAVISFFQGTQR